MLHEITGPLFFLKKNHFPGLLSESSIHLVLKVIYFNVKKIKKMRFSKTFFIRKKKSEILFAKKVVVCVFCGGGGGNCVD